MDFKGNYTLRLKDATVAVNTDPYVYGYGDGSVEFLFEFHDDEFNTIEVKFTLDELLSRAVECKQREPDAIRQSKDHLEAAQARNNKEHRRRSAAAHIAWETRYAVYGPTGRSR